MIEPEPTDRPRIHFEIDILPPSVNKLYKPMHKGKRLSNEANQFIVAAKTQMLRQLSFSQPPLSPVNPVKLEIHFYYDVLCKGFPKKAERFKAKDSGNYLKLIEDIVASCVAMNDKNTNWHVLRKFDERKHGFSGVRIWVTELDYDDV